MVGVGRKKASRLLAGNGIKSRLEMTFQERLESRVIRIPGGCWFWGLDPDKYGHAPCGGGKQRPAHVLVWEFIHGRNVPTGMYVCHSCDTPACVRPDHLFLGTPQDNALDMVAKGRHGLMQNSRSVRGERGSGAKARKEQVAAIRVLFKEHGYTIAALARIFPVLGETQIRNIVKMRGWVSD